MIKELFESSFFMSNPNKGNHLINLMEKLYKGSFYLVDELACRDCKRICNSSSHERKQLHVFTKGEVYVMRMDQVFMLLTDVGENCDYMLDDSERMALIEMTCTSSEYATSKRQKAKGQLYNTLVTICSNQDVKNHINRKKARFVIFSWKDTSLDEPYDAAEESMIAMTRMSDEVYSVDNVSNFDFGFKYKEIRYPDILNWDNLLSVQKV